MLLEVGYELFINGEKYRVFSINKDEINLHNEKGALKTIIVKSEG